MSVYFTHLARRPLDGGRIILPDMEKEFLNKYGKVLHDLDKKSLMEKVLFPAIKTGKIDIVDCLLSNNLLK